MADIYVRSYTGPVFTAAVDTSTPPTLGQLVYHDGTDFVLADADLHTTPAQYVVVGVSHFGGTRYATLARKAVLEDADAPYTLGDVQYLSTTAGGITTTMPTAAADLVQVVGRSINDSQVEIDIHQPTLWNRWFDRNTYDTSGEAGLGVVTDGWPGPGLDAGAETAYITGQYPYNFIEQLRARIVVFNTATSAVDYDFTVVAGYPGQSAAGDTGTALTTTDVDNTPPADNILETFDVAALLDAGLQGPGRLFSILLDPDGVGSAEQIILGLEMVCLVA